MPPIDPVRIVERVHGHLGWLAALALLHPAILLRRYKRKAHLAVGLAVAVVTLVGGIGAAIYPAYRERLRQHIFIEGRPIGYLFERKEHLAFGAVLLAWAGGIAYVAAIWTDGPTREAMRRAAHWSFVAAAVLTLVTASLGIVIAAFKTF